MVSKNVKILFGECVGIFLFLSVALGKSDFQGNNSLKLYKGLWLNGYFEFRLPQLQP